MLRKERKSELRPCNKPRTARSGMCRDRRKAARAGNLVKPSRSDLRTVVRSEMSASEIRRMRFGN